MEDFFRDFFGRIEYCVPVRTTHFQTDRRKNQLVMMVQRACECMPARRLGVGRTRRSASVDSGVPVSIRSAGWFLCLHPVSSPVSRKYNSLSVSHSSPGSSTARGFYPSHACNDSDSIRVTSTLFVSLQLSELQLSELCLRDRPDSRGAILHTRSTAITRDTSITT